MTRSLVTPVTVFDYLLRLDGERKGALADLKRQAALHGVEAVADCAERANGALAEAERALSAVPEAQRWMGPSRATGVFADAHRAMVVYQQAMEEAATVLAGVTSGPSAMEKA